MRRKLLCFFINLLFVVSMVSACAQNDSDTNADSFNGTVEYETADPGEETLTLYPAVIGDNLFTLRYNAQSSLNPLTGKNSDNLLIASLMYECLFELDDALAAQPVLCESYSTADYKTYTFKIMPDVAMTDGSKLTEDDVVYSLLKATESERYAQRFRNVVSVSAEDDLIVTIELSSPNSMFLQLLDVPIIKYGSLELRVPPGTGPYALLNSDEPRLVRFADYRDATLLPVSNIYLKECSDIELRELFSDGVIDLILDDPTDSNDYNISRYHEVRYYQTTTLQYIGFNSREEALSIAEVRRAIGCAVDREYITGTIMGGQAIAAPLVLSRFSDYYDLSWEPAVDNALQEMSAILAAVGFADNDNDSYLEYPSSGGGYKTLSLDFIVNEENSYKITAAQKIADSLARIGLDITLRKLPWDEFIFALETGDFDMYYGETALPADYDLSRLIGRGAPLDYGGICTDQYEVLITSFLSASPAELSSRAKLLCDEVYRYAPIVPIAYKKYAVRSGKGVISGASPTQSNAFSNITQWSINLD